MTEEEANRYRLSLATRLHGAATILVEVMLTPADGKVSTLDLHIMCGLAERVERYVDVFGPAEGPAVELLWQLMSRTEAIRTYVDGEILAGRFDPKLGNGQ